MTGRGRPLSQVMAALGDIAPWALAEPWDRAGLRFGDPDAVVTRVLVALDLTLAVVAEAEHRAAELVVAYHPPLWQQAPEAPLCQVAQAALRAQLAVASPHTAWDAAPGGANDALAALLGLKDVRPIEPARQQARGSLLRVTVPVAQVDAVRRALAAAGAGRLGAYEGCSFRVGGVGAFTPRPEAQPSIGQAGEPEEVDEALLEMWVPDPALPQAVAALRRHHPYEEPAFQLMETRAKPRVDAGQGRLGHSGLATGALGERLGAGLGLGRVLLALPPGRRAEAPSGQVAVAVGSGAALMPAARRAGAQVLVTGELSHHQARWALAHGMAVLAAQHGASERPGVEALAARLAAHAALAPLSVELSQADEPLWREV